MVMSRSDLVMSDTQDVAGEKRTSVAFDRMADRYDETRGGEARGSSMADMLGPWLDAAGPVLEIGIGTGLIASALRSRGVDVVGVDLSMPMLAKARDRVGPRLVVADAMRLPVRDGAVAAAYMVHVLHLVGDVATTLAEARRVVCDGGRVVATCLGDEGSTNDAADVVRELFVQVSRQRRDRPAVITAEAAGVGLRLEHEQLWSRPHQITANQTAAQLEDRVWSWTWDIDDATWSAVVLPAIARLRGLPDPDAPREVLDSRVMLVFRR
jgi:ubiquinone/menaquinone biosynthesis C-methylase UbiE